MDTTKLRKWDTAEHLETEEDMAGYLEACLEEAGPLSPRRWAPSPAPAA